MSSQAGTPNIANAPIADVLAEIMRLQTEYTHRNTAAMARRGVLVRHDLVAWMRSQLPSLRTSVPSSVDDLAASGRDGTGRKTEIPWARLNSASRSPSATEGWYLVYLFSAAGDGVYLSLNQGTTRWEGGEFRSRPVHELAARVAWACGVLAPEISARPDLRTAIDLHTNGRLGSGYEVGNVVSLQYRLDTIPDEGQLAEDLRFMTQLLGRLYAEADTALTLPGEPAPEVADAMAAVERAAGNRGLRQGFRLTAHEKKAVENRAVLVVSDYLCAAGWGVKDVGAIQPYDLDARRDDQRMCVEVKGTTSAGEEVILTRGEVELHRAHYPHNMLAIVAGINLDRRGETPTASGGELRMISPWMIEDEALTPIAYRYTV